MSSPEKSSPLKATTSTFDDEELEPGEVPSVSSRFKEFQGIYLLKLFQFDFNWNRKELKYSDKNRLNTFS